METRTLIRSSADVLRITSLQKGDVYKRLVESEHGGSDSVLMGVVTDVLSNGEKCAISVIEIGCDQWGAFTVRVANFAGARELAIFPASVDEIQTFMADAIERARDDVERKELATARTVLERLERIASGDMSKDLHAAALEPVENLS